jgi:hypothetical protein
VRAAAFSAANYESIISSSSRGEIALMRVDVSGFQFLIRRNWNCHLTDNLHSSFAIQHRLFVPIRGSQLSESIRLTTINSSQSTRPLEPSQLNHCFFPLPSPTTQFEPGRFDVDVPGSQLLPLSEIRSTRGLTGKQATVLPAKCSNRRKSPGCTSVGQTRLHTWHMYSLDAVVTRQQV